MRLRDPDATARRDQTINAAPRLIDPTRRGSCGPQRAMSIAKAGIVITTRGTPTTIAATVRRPRRPGGQRTTVAASADNPSASTASRSIPQTCGPHRCVGAPSVCHWTAFQTIHPGRYRSSSGFLPVSASGSWSSDVSMAAQSSTIEGKVCATRGAIIVSVAAIAIAAASSTTVARDSVTRVVTSSDPGFPLSTSSAKAWSACPIRAPDPREREAVRSDASARFYHWSSVARLGDDGPTGTVKAASRRLRRRRARCVGADATRSACLCRQSTMPSDSPTRGSAFG